MPADSFDIAGRTALVTGSSRGIGRAFAPGLLGAADRSRHRSIGILGTNGIGPGYLDTELTSELAGDGVQLVASPQRVRATTTAGSGAARTG